MLIDTHAHLNFPDYKRDLDEVINRSVRNGVTKIICVSSNIGDSQKAIEIAQKYPGVVYAAVGIHPQKTDLANNDSPKEQIKKLAKSAKQKEVVAIGECGLDYSSIPPGEAERSKEEQFSLFKSQLELAQKLKLPVIIHSRKALNDVFSIINQQLAISNLCGVFHCYSGGKSDIKRVKELGFYFGVDGNLTYDAGLQNVVREIAIEKVVLETDAPFLSPEPFRGLRNTPENVKIIAEFLAKLKGENLERVVQVTTQNAKRLFNI